MRMLNLEIESVPQHTLREEVDVVIAVVYIIISSCAITACVTPKFSRVDVRLHRAEA
jgi:hypothetical protein